MENDCRAPFGQQDIAPRNAIEPPTGDLARARVLTEIFRPHYEFWAVDVKQKNGTTMHGRVLAGSAEEAAHRAAIAGEVVSIELAPS